LNVRCMVATALVFAKCRIRNVFVVCHPFSISLSGWQKHETLSTNFRIFMWYCHVTAGSLITLSSTCVSDNLLRKLLCMMQLTVCYSRCWKWPPTTLRHTWYLVNRLTSVFLRFLPKNFWYCMPDNLSKVVPPTLYLSLSPLSLVFCLCALGERDMGMHLCCFYLYFSEISLQIICTWHKIRWMSRPQKMTAYSVPRNVKHGSCWVIDCICSCAVLLEESVFIFLVA
jgi:hypothetical protein